MFCGQVMMTYDECLKGDYKNKWKNAIDTEKELLRQKNTCVSAVSYTHLDVYKRQARYHSDQLTNEVCFLL